MRYHFHLRKWIHIIANSTADGLTNMLHIIKSLNIAAIIHSKE